MTLDSYIKSISDKRIAVIGAGVSNIPLINLLMYYGCDVTVLDKRSLSQLGQIAFDFISKGAKLALGDDYLEHLNHDIIFRSPSILPNEPHLANAIKSGVTVTSEMELFFELCPCRTIAITGSDGKTTTSTIISEVLKKAGYTVHLGGNIGKPLLCDVPFMKSDDFAVIELSSFQLHSMKCSPDIAVVTNVSPNHLDIHTDFEDYVDSKRNIFGNQKSDALLVLNADDPFFEDFYNSAPARKLCFSGKKTLSDGAFLRDNTIYLSSDNEEQPILSTDNILLPGYHNVLNYMTALCAINEIVRITDFVDVAEKFAGVKHRLQLVRAINGIKIVNDSIGSSPTRTIAGINAVNTPIRLIAGGYDKKIDFNELAEVICEKVSSVILTGATAQKIYNAILSSPNYDKSRTAVDIIDDFDEAVRHAVNTAEPGDTVLFSPACSSFDRFKNFEERGNHFIKIIMEL